MNPEEEFARLHDEDLWTVAPLVARGNPNHRPRRQLVLQWAVPIVAGFAIVALVLAGGNAIKSASKPVAVEPTPTVSAAWNPTPVFGGDCSNVFSDEQADAVLATSQATSVPVYDADTEFDLRPDLQVIQHQGGITCEWKDPAKTSEGLNIPKLEVAVIPAAALPGLVSDPKNCSSTMSEQCSFSIRSGEYVLSGSFVSSVGAPHVLGLLSRAFEAAATAAGPAPAVWKQQPGDWPASVDCATWNARAGLAESLDQGAWKGITEDVRSGTYPAVRALALGHGVTYCTFGSVNADDPGHLAFINAEVLSGGAWLRAEVMQLPGARSISVSGTDRSVVVPQSGPDADERSSIFLFSGSNCVEVFGSNEKDVTQLYPALPGIVSALNSLT